MNKGEKPPTEDILLNEWHFRLSDTESSQSKGYEGLREYAIREGFIKPPQEAEEEKEEGEEEEGDEGEGGEENVGVFKNFNFVFLNKRESDSMLNAAVIFRNMIEVCFILLCFRLLT